ncbi:MAG: hypothetical protein QG594_2427 [Bacteroidota bacterium]|jgi:recombinational DNA repair protein RecR|nr:hypothetical protein [Bacteroidota bacterium]
MKKLVILLVAALFMSVVSVNAKELKPKKAFATTTLEITSLLNPTSAVGILDFDQTVKVKIMISDKKEIMVLETSTENVELSNYIKEKLNLKKLSTTELQEGVAYDFEVNFKA